MFTNWLPKLSAPGAVDQVTEALAAVPRLATFDQAEDSDPRMDALYVWDILPAQPLSTAWTL